METSEPVPVMEVARRTVCMRCKGDLYISPYMPVPPGGFRHSGICPPS